LVAAYLQERGYRILEKGYFCRLGEIDLIALDGEILCFVEVKARTDVKMGLPREAVTPAKQRKLKKAALNYLQRHLQHAERCCRFDVAEVFLDEDARIEYLENAFM